MLACVGGPSGIPREGPVPERGLLAFGQAWAFTRTFALQSFYGAGGGCPLKKAYRHAESDLVIVRELIAARIWRAQNRNLNGEEKASDLMAYSEHEIERIARVVLRRQ
jgi:3-isopropylmalate dehydrogenase